MSSQRYDTVVIGAGTNGLTCASLLAQHGRKVLVCEERNVVGGLVAEDEFLPGYRSAGLLQDTARLRPAVVEALQLESHGLEWEDDEAGVLALESSAKGFFLYEDPVRAAKEIEKFSAADAKSYTEFHQFISTVRPVVERYLDESPPNMLDPSLSDLWRLMIQGAGLRRLGSKDMMELLRLPVMCVADWVSEWFENDHLRAALALPAVAGSFSGPWSPGSTANLLFSICQARRSVLGGGPAVVKALSQAAADQDVEIRTGTKVIGLKPGDPWLISLEGGETLEAKTVAASCDPARTFRELLPRQALSLRLESRVESYRTRGTTAQVLLALSKPLEYGCLPGQQVSFARSGVHVDEIERAFDAVKYRQVPTKPVLEIHVPSFANPELAPAGHCVVSVLVHFTPYDLEGGWGEPQKEALGHQVMGLLEGVAPGVGKSLVGTQVLSPVDLESTYGITGGQIHHGEHGLDQLLVRPFPEAQGYKTTLDGLFLCGSGSHPGGGLTCAPGMLAASTLLKAA